MSIDLTDYSSHCKAHQKLIVSKDPKSRCEHIADNQKQALVRQYHIDGDVICDPSLEKCDWMVLNDDKKSAYLIEIKGSDIHKGMRQIDSTYRQLHTSLPEYTFYFRIIYPLLARILPPL